MMQPPRIILIEDNPTDVFLFKLALEEHGIAHTLTEFESGLTRFRRWRQTRQSPFQT